MWRGKNGNAVRMNSGCGPICHMIDTEVCTSVYMTSFPASCWWDDGVNELEMGGEKLVVRISYPLLNSNSN
jgi:hypothetical protein